MPPWVSCVFTTHQPEESMNITEILEKANEFRNSIQTLSDNIDGHRDEVLFEPPHRPGTKQRQMMMEELGMIQGLSAPLADQMDSAVEEISALVDC